MIGARCCDLRPSERRCDICPYNKYDAKECAGILKDHIVMLAESYIHIVNNERKILEGSYKGSTAGVVFKNEPIKENERNESDH